MVLWILRKRKNLDVTNQCNCKPPLNTGIKIIYRCRYSIHGYSSSMESRRNLFFKRKTPGIELCNHGSKMGVLITSSTVLMILNKKHTLWTFTDYASIRTSPWNSRIGIYTSSIWTVALLAIFWIEENTISQFIIMNMNYVQYMYQFTWVAGNRPDTVFLHRVTHESVDSRRYYSRLASIKKILFRHWTLCRIDI